LIIVILSFIPQTQAVQPVTSLLPLVFVLTVSAIKDGIEDYRRSRSDREINMRSCVIMREGSLLPDSLWQDVRVGDIVKMVSDEFVPADMLILSTSEDDGNAYIDTSSMDGETNLKLRQAHLATKAKYTTTGELHSLRCHTESEAPNRDIHKFEGRLFVGDERHSVGISNMLLRGCILRNTAWVYGLVLYTGHDTKLMMNSTKGRLKRSRVEQHMNFEIILVFLLLAAICFFAAIWSGVWISETGVRQWQIDENTNAGAQAVINFFSFLLVMQTLVPISLYVTLEVVKVVQTWFIAQDLDMYHAETDRPAQPRTSALSEELGQIEYVFSDKTGTLTQNVMEFYGCSIRGVPYGILENSLDDHSGPVSPPLCEYSPLDFKFGCPALIQAIRRKDPETVQFFELLALCHTVLPEQKSESLQSLVYQAQSPDEGALVSAARNFGFAFVSRTAESMTVNALGKRETYDLLNVLEFNSDRKRMSVIVRRHADRALILLTKGADDKILALLDANELKSQLVKTTRDHLHEFARQGLRTLCLGSRIVPEDEFTEWAARYKEATLASDNREEKVDAVAAEIEVNLRLLGATAVDDKLQDGVPDTIASLMLAGIKVWVLTGDKQETAVNIGFSCRLLTSDMNVIMVNAQSEEACMSELLEALDVFVHRTKVGRTGPQMLREDNALVIDGPTLTYALKSTISPTFLDLALRCKAVLCCRCSPSQKSKVVDLVRITKSAVTLSIGDGANDVPMIKSADVGVGISGREGMQAVLASDYAISQFR
jgi:phospholipid-translocating P-type ATPase (flippase)